MDSWVGMDSGDETSGYTAARIILSAVYSFVGLPTSPDYARMFLLCSMISKPYYARHYAGIARAQCVAKTTPPQYRSLLVLKKEVYNYNMGIIWVLSSAKVPSRLEPSGLYRSDGKRPDGITIVPWKNGKLLVWDATCPDTYAPSYSALATRESGAVAAQAEERKCSKYCHLVSSHTFAPVAIETSGAIGPRTSEFLRELGRWLRQVTGEVKSTIYLLQHLSVAIQRGNAASVFGTISHSADLENFL